MSRNASRTVLLGTTWIVLAGAWIGPAEGQRRVASGRAAAGSTQSMGGAGGGGGFDDFLPPTAKVLSRRHLGVRVEPAEGSGTSTTQFSGENWAPMPKMLGSFVVPRDASAIALTFSAEAWTSADNLRLAVRAKLDSELMDPGDVIFCEGRMGGARSFVFTGVVEAGIHTVEMEWHTDPGGTAFLGAASIQVLTGIQGELAVFTPPSGLEDFTREDEWEPIPDGDMDFDVAEESDLILFFSAETVCDEDDEVLYVRAVLDPGEAGEEVLAPGEVSFARSARRRVHTMVFGAEDLSPGTHTIEMQWRTDDGGTVFVGDLSLAASTHASSFAFGRRFESSADDAFALNTGVWIPIPDLATEVYIPENAELSATVCVEVLGLSASSARVRLLVAGVLASAESAVVMDLGTGYEVHSFTLDAKHLFTPGGHGGFYEVRVEGRIDGGAAVLRDRSLALFVEPGDVPDLMEAQVLGANFSRVEPVVGTRKLLTILYDPGRPEHPAPPVAVIEDALYGNHSVADYFDVVSGGRFALENVGVFGWYPGSWADGWHTWDGDLHPNCDDGGGHDDFTSGGQERWYEALTAVDADFDFAQHDLDQDGVLQRDELAILLVIPQETTGGSARWIDPFCSSNVTFDGVALTWGAEWFTGDDPVADLSVPAHELAHTILWLDDMYIGGNVDTEAGKLSLMGSNIGTTSHIDAVQKLSLGWVDPVFVEKTGWYDIEDVADSGQVFVLQRNADGDGRECFVIENRRESLAFTRYDQSIGDDGLAVWHYVEAKERSEESPTCLGAAEWLTWPSADVNSSRRSIRLLRPTIAYDDDAKSLWAVSSLYDLIDVGEVCPVEGDNGWERRNVLKWAGGKPSGYQVLNFPPQAEVMSVVIVVP